MRVMLLIDSLVSGGMERRVVELIKGFQAKPDVQLHLVIFSEKIHYTEIYDLNVTVTILKRVPKKNPKVFYRLYRLCQEWKPDMLHSWGTMSAIMAVPTAVLLRIKLINGFVVDASHNMTYFDERRVRARLTFPFSKVIVGNSLAGLKAYKVSAKKAVCIYNGFNASRITALEDEESIRKKFNITSEKVVGMVASFTIEKDHKTFIDAGLLVLEQDKNVTFMAVGRGDNLDQCKKMIPAAYQNKFVFTGEQKDVESIVNIFDVGVLTSNTEVHGEGISNAILEYMALAKPVVATNSGGTCEIVENGQTGFLIPNAGPQLLAERILQLIKNSNDAQQMGKRGEQRITTMFSIEKMIAAYYELYQKILKED